MPNLTTLQKETRDKEMLNLNGRVFSLIDTDKGQTEINRLLRNARAGHNTMGVLWRLGPEVQVRENFDLPVRMSRNEVNEALDRFLRGDHFYAKHLGAVISELGDEGFSKDLNYRPKFDSLQVEIAGIAHDPNRIRRMSAADYTRLGRLFFGGSFEFKRYIADFICTPNEEVTRDLETQLSELATERYLPQILIFQGSRPDIDLTPTDAPVNLSVNFRYYYPKKFNGHHTSDSFNLQTYFGSQEWPQLSLIQGGRED